MDACLREFYVAIVKRFSLLILLAGCGHPPGGTIPDGGSPAVREAQPLARRIDSTVTRLLADRMIPGAAVAVLRADTLIHAAGYGVAKLATGTPVSTSTVFQIASTTKPFTAMAILMLVEEGKIALDAIASRYLTWLPKKYATVTVRQLLTHTSGVYPDLRTQNVDEFDIAEFRRRLNEREASFPPGTKVQYANTGFTLLSFIVEAASGEDFGQFLERRVFRPLSMHSAGYRAPQEDDRLKARGYEIVDGRLIEAPHVFSGWGNSGIELSVTDMIRFAVALERRLLLQSASYDLMYAPARYANDSVVTFRSNDVPSQFGLSWFISSYRGAPLVSHGGAVAGFSSSLERYMRDGWTIIVLSNGKQGADRGSQAAAIARAIADLTVVPR